MLRNTAKLKNQLFDLLVCGGGIYGAWTAYDASLRGLNVALIDKGDWASGTSSASSKLIHGGLRYLETFNFKLVKKSLAERQMLLNTAPHRVWPLRFGIPSYRRNRLNPIKIKFGLWLYDFLAGKLSETHKRRNFTGTEFLAHFPGLTRNGLTGGFSYFDAQTDDARFVVEIIDGALTSGAACVNYCEALDIIEVNDVIHGVTAKDHVNNDTFEIHARQVVDTTGRWSAQFQHKPENFRLAKGIHLILPKILAEEALLLTAQHDGRVFFIIPWQGLTLVGTTDTDYRGNLDDIEIPQQDVDYLLTEVNLALENKLTEQDIIGKFAGLRVLQDSSKKNPSAVSRDWSLLTSTNGLLTSLGGKFTSAREDAAVIVDKVSHNLGIKSECRTFGKPFPWLLTSDYPALLEKISDEAKTLGIDADSAICLAQRHGENSAKVLALCRYDSSLCRRILPELPFLLADLAFCAEYEMVEHLDDLIRRRLPLLILARLDLKTLSQLAEIAGKSLGWDRTRIAHEVSRCQPMISNTG